VTLEDGTESAKMKTRSAVTEQLIGDLAETHHVRARGTALLEKLLSLAFFGDFVSIYLAALNGIDPENIDSINTLKAELGKVS
jgi:glucose/mannose-6-phosphate isomerase